MHILYVIALDHAMGFGRGERILIADLLKNLN